MTHSDFFLPSSLEKEVFVEKGGKWVCSLCGTGAYKLVSGSFMHGRHGTLCEEALTLAKITEGPTL